MTTATIDPKAAARALRQNGWQVKQHGLRWICKDRVGEALEVVDNDGLAAVAHLVTGHPEYTVDHVIAEMEAQEREAAETPAQVDAFQAPAAAAARDQFAAYGRILTYRERSGWMLDDTGPMSWPEVEKHLARITIPPGRRGGASAPATLYVALDRIRPNPWQPRLSTDETYIAELAADIQGRLASRPSTCGLLQLPAGRFVDKKGKPIELRYPHGGLVGGGGELLNGTGDLTDTMAAAGAYLQLAYGHNRFAAFQHLAKTDPRYGALPIAVVTFTDEEMATAAWGENAQRRDLTVYEQAKAIEKYIADFAWTQEQAAQRLKLDRSTIANKLRLLRLPKETQKQLKAGQLSERQALALLPLTELPTAAIEHAEKASWRKPSELLKKATTMSSDDIRSFVDHVVQAGTVPIDNVALMQHRFETTDADAADAAQQAGMALVSARCSDCPLRTTRGTTEHRCSDPSCLQVKRARWRGLRESAAATAAGLAAVGEVPWSQKEVFWNDEKLGAQIVQTGCAQLRLIYGSGGGPLHPQNFPDVSVICVHEVGKQCACLMRLKREQTKADPAAQRLKAAKKEVAEEIVAPAVAAIAAGLAAGNVGAWRAMLQSLNYSTRQQGAEADLIQLQALIATHLVRQALPYKADEQPKATRAAVAKLLTTAGLAVPWDAPAAAPAQVAADVCAQTPAPPAAFEDGPLAELWRKLNRITSWIDRATAEPPTLAAIQGNRDNLAQLAEALEELADDPDIPDEEYEALTGALGEAELRLGQLAEIGAAPELSEVEV